jgi:hypothetical protein
MKWFFDSDTVGDALVVVVAIVILGLIITGILS